MFVACSTERCTRCAAWCQESENLRVLLRLELTLGVHRDESIKRVELALLNNYSDPLPYDPQFEEEQRTAVRLRL